MVVIGGGTISLKPTMFINNVLLVDGFKYNLLSISQLCDVGIVLFLIEIDV